MCNDGTAESSRSGLGSAMVSRRGLLAGGALAAGAGAAGIAVWPRGPRPVDRGGAQAVSMAMHLHTSFSEQSGSMDGHLDQAQRNGVDVVWWTDHDFRMSSMFYRRVVHFTSLSAERGSAGEGETPWEWREDRSGPLTRDSSGGIVGSPHSPLDTVASGSLSVTAHSTSRFPAAVKFTADAHKAGWNYTCTLTGQIFRFEVLPTSTGPDGYLEFLLSSSYHPARGGRPAGKYSVSYRIGPPSTGPTRTANGLLGVVNVPATLGRWNSMRLRPSDDIAALWPDLDARDFGSFGLTFGAVSTGSTSSGYFDYLRISRQQSGEVQLATQRALQAEYRRYPKVTQHQGLEVSLSTTHLNWFGGNVALPDYAGVNLFNYDAYLRRTVVPDIHRVGGLASLNHPFGAGSGPRLPRATQQRLMQQLGTALITSKALGTDLMEVGYHQRAGVDISHHIGLWDICSRNGIFLTGTGTTDDHFCTGWRGVANDWITFAWAANTSEPALLSALRRGRSWSTSSSRYRGALDLEADGGHPMGSVSFSDSTRRTVNVTATDLPSGGVLEVVQGPADYAGPGHPEPGNTSIARFRAHELKRNSVAVKVDTTEPTFVRTVVHDATNQIVGLSNPVWLLRDLPPSDIPSGRAN